MFYNCFVWLLSAFVHADHLIQRECVKGKRYVDVMTDNYQTQ